MTTSPPDLLPRSRPRRSGWRTGRRSLGLALAVLLIPLPFLAGGPAPVAQADTAPPAGLPTTVSTDPLPTAQIDGVVWDQEIVGNTVYVGGDFTTARPAGAAPDTQTVARTSLLAYDLSSGVLNPTFHPLLDGQVKAVAASPDGSTLYIAGTFTHVDNQPRSRIAAFAVATGQLTSFAPVLNGIAFGLTVTSSTVYVGGAFTSVSPFGDSDPAHAVTRQRVAALDRTTALPNAMQAPVTDQSVRQLVLSPDGTKLVIGGNFTSVGTSTTPGYGLAMLNASTGAMLPLPVNSLVRDAGDKSSIYSLAATADGFYGSGYAQGKVDGNLEGAFRADWSGNLVWVEDCHGDTYSIFPSGSELYVAGHPHFCGNIGGFPQNTPFTNQRGLAFTQAATGTVARDQYSYFNYEGKPRPTLLTWFPDIDTGDWTGQTQGAWSVSGNASYVLYGGEFKNVNETAQQGLVRFARTTIAPNTDGPRLSGAAYKPAVRSFAQGVRVSWPANYDRDNELLTYRLIRNGNTAAPVYTTTARSTFWQRPNLSFLDTAVTSGVSYTYELRVSDPKGNTVTGDPTSIAAAGGSSLSGYDQTVLADGPNYLWRFNETSGTYVSDTTGTLGATRSPGVTGPFPGAITGDPGTAFRFSGDSTGYLSTTTSKRGLQTFSVEAWIKTTTTTGGKIIGFGSSSSGASALSDRHIFMGNSGRLYFGVYPGAAKTVASAAAYNDGKWHHVVGTLGDAGMGLYVDGASVGTLPTITTAQIYDGFWRVGGDALSWPGAPTSSYFAGDIDDAAVYPQALSAAQVQAHYAAGTGTTVANKAPTPAFTSSTTGLVASLDASGSTDADGTIASYAWTFGDTGTGTGRTTSHSYSSAGTYPVQLTVTDNSGATASITKNVTVTAPTAAAFVTDPFDRTVTGGLGTADVGGAWTVSSTSGFAVSGGAGLAKLDTAGTTRSARLDAVHQTDADLRLDFSVDKPATGSSGIQLLVQGRRVASGTEYRTVVRLNTAGKVYVSLEGANGGSVVTTLAPATALADTVVAGTVVHVRMQTFGTSPTTVRAKVWTGSAAEPAAWTATATDSAAVLQAAGSVGFSAYLSSAATNAPVTLSVLDLSAAPTSN